MGRASVGQASRLLIRDSVILLKKEMTGRTPVPPGVSERLADPGEMSI